MSFFTGFATGLAKSVDTQLKESIERTRDNIDMVSKWRLKKAEERERERKSKDKEIQTLIQDAAYVISGNQNDVDAQNIAAALYKERGLSGFTDDIAFMREQSKTGVRPIDFIQRASIDVPANKFGLSEIVRSLSDAESSFAASDMVFPKGTIKGSGLISALVPDFDVTAAGGAQAKEQMQQIGFTTTPTAPSLSFDKFTFDREGMNYSSKSTNDKLAYLNDIAINPASTEPEREKARKRRDALLALAIEQGDDETALKAVDQQLSLMEPLNADGSENVDYTNALSEKQRIGDKIKLEQAQLEGEAAVLRTQALIAARDGDPAKSTRLNRKADDLDAGGFVPYETQIARLNEDIQRNISKHGDRYRNSEGPFAGKGMAEDIAIRNRLKTEQANLAGTTEASVNAAFNTLYATAKKNLQRNNPRLEAALTALSDIDMTEPANLGKILKVLEDSGVNSTEEFNKALEAAVETHMNQAIAEGWNTRSVTLAAQKFEGLDLPALAGGAAETGADTGAVAGTLPTTEETQRLLEATTPEAMQREYEVAAGFRLSQDQINTLETRYPNNTSGATSIVSDLSMNGKTFDEIIAGASDIHDASFAAEVEKAVTAIETAADVAVAENAIPDITTPESAVILSGQKKSAVVAELADELNLSSDAVSVILDNAVEKANAPIRMSADQATVENVMNVLDKEGLIALGGGVAPMRREKAVLAVANAFNIDTEDAEGILDNALRASKPDAPETTDERIKRLKPDVVFDEDAMQALFRGRPAFPPRSGPVPYRRIGDQFYEIKDDGTLSDKPASRSITRELLKKLGGKTSDVVDKITTGLSKEDASEDSSTKTVLDAQEQVTETKFKPSAIQLAMKFIDGTLEGEERSEFRKELTGPNGKELAAAIQMIRDRRKAEKEVSAYRSRGGLMGR